MRDDELVDSADLVLGQLVCDRRDDEVDLLGALEAVPVSGCGRASARGSEVVRLRTKRSWARTNADEPSST
jgi:hypothetical protein